MTQMPLATVYGEPMLEAPAALYIPPAVLTVMSDNFSGPMDLLLYLVRRHRFDILDIPMAELCKQYAVYVEEALKSEDNWETAADYLAMAALLADIKSKMMLPAPPAQEEDENDPRADLVRRLLEYERIRDAAQKISALPRRERDFVIANPGVEIPAPEKTKPVLHPAQLSAAFSAVLARMKRLTPYQMTVRNINLRGMMSGMLRILAQAKRLTFARLVMERMPGASFLAVLMLAAEQTVHLRQASPEDELHVEIGTGGETDEHTAS